MTAEIFEALMLICFGLAWPLSIYRVWKTKVGMIKAMEIPNEVIADELGIVQEFLVEDGQTVEYGTPLMIVRKG